jgi:uncharacterized protein (UPF0297 family)
MKQAILVGCGKIGAGYDMDNPSLILTHTKAYFLSKKTNLYKVIDKDLNTAKKVASLYNCKYSNKLTKDDLEKCNIISIATPTEFHFETLGYLHVNNFQGKIILEKPAVSNKNEIKKLLSFDKKFLDQIFINYIRRYDKTYSKILYELKTGKHGEIKKIKTNMFGSMEHNGVHIINILNYIFNSYPKILFNSQKTTILKYLETEVVINKLSTPYLNFDLVFFTQNKKIVFDELGYRLTIYKPTTSKQFNEVTILNKIATESILHTYALDMIDAILENKTTIPTIYEGIEDMRIVKEIECSQ